MTQMPGTARCARAILVVVGTVNAATVAWLTAAAATLETGALGELVLGILLLAAIVSAALAIASFTIAAKFTHGSSKTRTGAAAVGWITILAGTIALLTDHPMGAAGAAAGTLLTALSTRTGTRDWFDRPRLPRPPRNANH
ncbi:hypothetical protein AQJ43_28600 [Streptomyces avermitilis]|uniref:Secreted protein n=2 Tax=Streptomyces avermitilis TaxID=33903 RepID=Q82PU1_STRAW|nr:MULTISPECIES: hypothetical protein [Streptomyces]KUN51205.1 hypothetical protein AQJ43_28600 [Streptomyces avermitilis]MYS96423.1 hypothetical protein [Streptomyces sp. SID5469]OOV17897.1 hypothetical protein SM007_37715 [Streptomyces avermitilis]BAC68491.1 putative secreted protein [Streptomyces avermitilis MA-4680 = NBRC 14893]BBJ48345.1 hypothetical protein SAVMC3_09740 [Streptomyces avermitilis]